MWILKKKVLLSVLLLTIACLALSGCASKEAKQVMEDIDSLGEITLDSDDDLVAVNEEYNDLTKEDKEDVSNYEVLEEKNQTYNKLKCEDLDNRIKKACKNIDADSYDTLLRLQDEYNELDEDVKANVTKSEDLQEGIENAKEEKAVQIYWSILANVREEKSTAERLLLLYKDILSDEQKKGSLVEIARWGVVSKCEDLLKENLKSPKSYTQYSVSTTGPSLQDDGQYYISVDIKYGANNSFNAEVTDTAQFDAYYTIDVENLTYNYKDVDFSAYYKFKIANRNS